LNVLDLTPCSSIKDLVKQLKYAAFNARRLGKAFEILEEALQEQSFFFIGLAGALTPSGMRYLIAQLLNKLPNSLVVSTGANVLHDIAASLGKPAFHVETLEDDISLSRRGLMRIHDIVTSADAYVEVESLLKKVVEELPAGSYASYEIVKALGAMIADEKSFIRTAYERHIDVIVPAFIDSILGLQFMSLTSVKKGVKLDQVKDLQRILDAQFIAKEKSMKTAAIILGGGVPKNFIYQSTLITEKPLDYVVQITTDVPEYGGLSGATPEEAKSWRKIGEKAKAIVVYCDVTIALPILVSALLQS